MKNYPANYDEKAREKEDKYFEQLKQEHGEFLPEEEAMLRDQYRLGWKHGRQKAQAELN